MPYFSSSRSNSLVVSVSLQIKFNLIDLIRRDFSGRWAQVELGQVELSSMAKMSVRSRPQGLFFPSDTTKNRDQKNDSRAFGGGVEAEKDCDKERGENI